MVDWVIELLVICNHPSNINSFWLYLKFGQNSPVFPILFLCSSEHSKLCFGAPEIFEGAEKGINFYALENRLFEELFKFLHACSNFRFSRVYYQKKTGHIALIFRFYCPVFGLFSQDLTQILLRHSAS